MRPSPRMLSWHKSTKVSFPQRSMSDLPGILDEVCFPGEGPMWHQLRVTPSRKILTYVIVIIACRSAALRV